MAKMIKVRSVEHLKKLTCDRTGDFKMMLNFGVFSRKYIKYNSKSKRFNIENCIDGSRQYLGVHGLTSGSNTMIGEAIDKGALWLEEIYDY